MQISSINDIIQGELLNSPAISFIYNVKTDVKKLLEGDLFFAENKEDIPIAIQQGAFAIVVEKHTLILDNEIAWIKVDNISKAIIKYIRYQLSQVTLNAYYCDDISFELFKAFLNNLAQTPVIWLFSNKLDDILSNIHGIKNNDILICNNQKLLSDMYPGYLQFNSKQFKVANLIEHSLFETSFNYQQNYFSHIKLSSMFINQFLEVTQFIDTSLDLNKLKKVNYFKPIFIDKFFNPCEYGKSDRFVLIQEKKELAKKELEYIYDKYKYAKTIIISKESLNLGEVKYLLIPKLENIFQQLQNTTFNAIYIVGFKKQEIELLFKNNNLINTLL